MGMHIKTHYTESQANDIFSISVNSYNNNSKFCFSARFHLLEQLSFLTHFHATGLLGG